jgi:hypothetical protein
MSVSRGFGLNGKSIYMNICKPQEIELNFIVDAANGNGLGVRSIKSNGYVRNVFMHTSSTPGVGLDGVVNPNPIAGYILIQFKNNFNYCLSGSNSIVSPVSGSPLTSTTAGHAYIIVSLGTASLSQWQAAGVPQGLTPSVGMSFIALATGTIGGSAAVEVPSFSSVDSIETVGDPNQSINPSNIAQNGGAYLLLQCVTSASGSPALATPASGSVIAMRFRFDGSSVSIPDGGPSNSAGSGGL